MDAHKAAREALHEFRQQDDYLLAHGASLMSEDSHEILHTDTLRRVVDAATAAQSDEIERLRDGIDACYRMLLREQNTVAALYRAEDILRGLLTHNDKANRRICRQGDEHAE